MRNASKPAVDGAVCTIRLQLLDRFSRNRHDLPVQKQKKKNKKLKT